MSYGKVSYGESSYGEPGEIDMSTVTVHENIEITQTEVGKWNSSQTVSDGFGISAILGFSKVFNGFATEDIEVSETIDLLTVANIIEAIQTSDTLSPSGTFGVIAVEGMGVSDTLYVAFPVSVLDAMGVSDTQVINKGHFVSLLEQAEIAESLASSTVWHVTNTDEINISDGAIGFWARVVSEILETSDTLLVHRIATITNTDILEVSDSILGSIQYSLELISSILMSESPLVGKHNSHVEVEEDILFSHLIERTDIDTYVMNPENYAISKYILGFTESAAFGNKYLFADDTGLYELGGTTDNGSAIISTIQTAALDFGTSNIKQVPSVLLGTNGSEMVLKVSVDGRSTSLYEISQRNSYLETKDVKLGKGLKGKYWQFTIISDDTDFDLDGFEFYPIQFGRKRH